MQSFIYIDSMDTDVNHKSNTKECIVCTCTSPINWMQYLCILIAINLCTILHNYSYNFLQDKAVKKQLDKSNNVVI